MNIREKGSKLPKALEEIYPVAECSLYATNDYELLFATRLSAQCTDARVNIVTPKLFETFDTLEKFANAEVSDVAELIKTCGLYKGKARDLVNAAKMLVNDFDGKVPNNMDDLLKLPGIGRKTANLILGDIYGAPSIIADTHCIRLSNRIGFVKDTKDPLKVEMALRKHIPQKYQTKFCHRLVHFGREFCTAQSPKCEICPITEFCNHYKKTFK
ncbi:MAG: endonuclease III [Clostridia bacterium]